MYVYSRMLYFHTDMRSHLKTNTYRKYIHTKKMHAYIFSVHFTFSVQYRLCKNNKNKTKTSTQLLTCSKQCACHYERVYWDAERHEMETLRTSWLIDEFERTLHSKHDYAAALDHTLMMCPELNEYMAEFQLVVTGDYPT